MRILVDDRECPSPASTVGQALNAAAQIAEASGRSVVDVYVDGEAWGDPELSDAARLAFEAGEVRCVTAHPGELLRETFLHAAEALIEAERLLREAAKQLQADDAKGGMSTLLEGLSVWMSIQRAAAHGTQFGGIDPKSVRTAEGSLDDAAHAVNRLLVQLRDAIQANDTVAASDCLLYEFPPVTRRWASILAELARRSSTLVPR
ncbi:MAG: hypothetical protein JNM94_16815 [Phycisphaerae bacterium]|nr:hypothetical protein [Phycisphaerae bacterium]